ncbi:unnamed protein product, partial [Ixodes pacificus]
SSSTVRFIFFHRNPGLSTRTNCRLVLNAGSRTRIKESTVRALLTELRHPPCTTSLLNIITASPFVSTYHPPPLT